MDVNMSGSIDAEVHQELQWGEDTDYLFHQDPLPKLTIRPKDTNARVLGRMLRQKLIYRIKLQTGREITNRANQTFNPFISDPNPPQFYAWHFTREYVRFPEGCLSNWSIQDIRDCNNALENGDFYLTDVRYPCSRPSPRSVNSLPFDASQQGLLAAKLNFKGSRAADRKRLISIAEGAFTNYIVQETGNSSFKFKTILQGNVLNQAQGLPGFRWVFPTVGVLREFPAHGFWTWSTDELLHGLHGLLTRTLTLERSDPLPDPVAPARSRAEAFDLQEQGAPSRLSDSSAVNSNCNRQSIDPKSNAASSCVAFQTEQPTRDSVENFAETAIPNVESGAGLAVPEMSSAVISDRSGEGVHGLDDLIAQLNSRAERWKADRVRLQKYELRERDLLVQNAVKDVRIKEFEVTLARIKSLGSAFGISGSGSSSDAGVSYPAVVSEIAMKDLEAFYAGQLGELRAQNEELTEIIQDQEDAVRESDQLRRRIRVLEKQLADKTLDASAAYEALNSYNRGNISNHRAHNQAMKPASFTNGSGTRTYERNSSVKDTTRKPQSEIGRCDRCGTEKQQCTDSGGPCIRCYATGKQYTFKSTDSNTHIPTTRSSPNTTAGQLDVSGTDAFAKKVATDTSCFLLAKQLQDQNTPQGPYRPRGKYPLQAAYATKPTPQFGSDSQFGWHPQVSPSKRTYETPASANDSCRGPPYWNVQNRQNGGVENGESSKSARLGSYQSPYPINDVS
ncbi:hypothetical protein BUE80_DR009621 [Diplocarpon rosae]|nr:hypothetical protein BUE80_DR009621 [Diplocarpon rosae]